MPLLSRAHYRREMIAWLFLPVMLGAVEGGVIGVLAKNLFAGTVEAHQLNLAVAVLMGAPAFANVTSFLWAALSHGRHKIRFLVALQVTTAVLIGLIALAPRDGTGLAVMTGGVVGARMCWSGVVTIRSTVWRQNYPRASRATVAGKLATVQSIMLSVVGLAVGAAMQMDQGAFRVIFPVAAAVGLLGTWFYSGLRMRGHRALVRAERRDDRAGAALISPLVIWDVLRGDRGFRRYMGCMFLFGTGNLMTAAPLVIMLRDRFAFAEFRSVLIASAIPTLLMPLSIPVWSHLLDRVHIVRFRAVHSWAMISSIVCLLIGAVALQPALLYTAAALKGVAFGGGVLGWNLGHHDFAPSHQAARYMGVHVTLTGLRGLVAPVAGVGLYELLEGVRPGSGPWVFAVCLALSLAGGLGFGLMSRSMRASPTVFPARLPTIG
jgi:MFS family permease